MPHDYGGPGNDFWPIAPITIWHKAFMGIYLQFGLTRVEGHVCPNKALGHFKCFQAFEYPNNALTPN